jgi:hypothetical protein
MHDDFDEQSGNDLGIRIRDRPVGIDLTQVCCKLHQDTARLPFLLNKFRCLGLKVVGRLHILLQPEQRKVIRKLTVEVKVDHYCSIDDFLDYTHDHKIQLSDYYSNLEQVVVVARSTDYSSTWQHKFQNINAARVRIMQDNETALEEIVTKHGAWE